MLSKSFSCVLAVMVFAVGSIAQTNDVLQTLRVHHLDLGFCAEPCISGHTPDLDLVHQSIKKSLSGIGSIEFDHQNGRIVFRDTQDSTRNIVAMIAKIDVPTSAATENILCTNKRTVTILFGVEDK